MQAMWRGHGDHRNPDSTIAEGAAYDENRADMKLIAQDAGGERLRE